eukprot:Tbor_TRINITY_DN2552_c0_g1::TRINITY_DN2552_c0_g1_i1::g.521::m.521/K03008/RPB11, POLR2J; DNA-directed RNA polymerase II subunit RPB11
MSRDTAHAVLIQHNDIDPESLVDLPGDKKVEEERRDQAENASLFKIAKEDHTLGYILQRKLHEHPNVAIAGYRVPHPTKHNIEIRVQTGSTYNGDTDEEVPNPAEALTWAVDGCISELEDFKTKLLRSAEFIGISVEPYVR